jgi:hypothetical protein
MRAFILATLLTSSVCSAAFAQPGRTVRDMMTELRATHGKTFEDCQSIATSLGYRISDDEADGRSVMMFIQGCIMGKTR